MAETYSTSSSSPAVEVRELHKHYKEGLFGRKGFHALKGIDLTVNRGEVFGLLGPNGAGKTTLIKVLLGIVRLTGGQASMLGERAGSREARRRIGYLPEHLTFPSHHTAIRALKLYGRLSYLSEQDIRQRSGMMLEQVGLNGREKEHVSKYSKGMRQRLGLAQAMLHDPDLLILDEPTDGLDPVGRSEIRKVINTLKDRGKTVFLNSHILQEVELVCDRVAILNGGRLVGTGTPGELIHQFHGALASRVRIEVSGPADEIASISNKLDCDVMNLPDATWQLTANIKTQEEIDHMVDFLRSRTISIAKLERTKPTLEEVFLSAVQTDDSNATAGHSGGTDSSGPSPYGVIQP